MKIKNILLLFASKWVGLWRRWQVWRARLYTKRYMPELLVAYAAFSRMGQSGSPRQPFKGWDLWKILQSIQPKSVVELGSGTTSAIFALWSIKSGAAYTAFEHHEDWAKITSQCLSAANLTPSAGSGVICVPSRVNEDQESVGFGQELPAAADFLYVDGPPCILEDGRKVANNDATRFLDRGLFPKAIVVDGRIETVDLILKHPAITRYLFKPSLAYCIRKGLFIQALAGREHSLFLRK
ncbi:MAG: hypothetical protein ACK4FK_05605 [Ferrovibrio sp.]|uniref:hypothetical protein n=1 Tax=Ferrovibrio sp. TaxID=1917215 RepID=UPI00391BF0A6